ncbi:pyridoxal phosphate-dependent aminotransferase [Pelagicoccus albus]|uniref:Aminotransferase class I/II-fold pyridoxal phosphate-dependent enzyme n=1 Tax=Pelagicoccus albus TaxID=415222 RepID=A0A7X1E8U9_9BACT|nr:aminotransferase class I/II-fold pyridoxal phosphate-dependent enzyme [Pelagicoccus albus]MBC2606513.1 aminotransferase class I/II-fold pyridoxal phosphate-dependent enzyme [Pelagicoccus albus]
MSIKPLLSGMEQRSSRLVASLFAAAALSLAPQVAFSQHEVDTDEGSQGPVKINGNENAFGYSQMAMMAIMQELPDINRYAFEETMELIDAIAMREMVPGDYIMPTAGSGPVLVMAAMAYAAPGKNVVSVEPGYTQLIRTFEKFGGETKLVALNDELEYDLEAVKAAIDENTVMVYLCNPNNPTGTIVDPDELKAFIRDLPDGVVAFVDEAYLELSEGGLEANSMISLVREGEDVILARTFSKVYGMAGLRVGYGVMKPEFKKKLSDFHMGGPNKLGCVAATASLQDPAFFEMSVSSYKSVRKMVTDRLDELGIEYATPHGSFVFMKTGVPIKEFQALMEAENVLVGRPFPPMFDWCRVSIGTEEEMTTFLSVFEEVMKGQGKL